MKEEYFIENSLYPLLQYQQTHDMDKHLITCESDSSTNIVAHYVDIKQASQTHKHKKTGHGNVSGQHNHTFREYLHAQPGL